MSEVTYTPGRFVWRDLTTTNLEKSRGFYGELMNWKIEKAMSVPGMEYWQIYTGDKAIGGMFEMNTPGIPAHWNSYVSVADVDAAADAAKANGGAVLNGPNTLPKVGRMATIRDGQGAVLSLFKSEMGDPPVARPNQGEFCWESLSTTDVAAAKKFYAAVAAWKVVKFGDMEVFGVDDTMQGGCASFGAPPPGVPSNWLTNVVVGSLSNPNSLAEANAKAVRLGGTVLMDRVDVPNVGSLSVIADNVGAHIALFCALPQG